VQRVQTPRRAIAESPTPVGAIAESPIPQGMLQWKDQSPGGPQTTAETLILEEGEHRLFLALAMILKHIFNFLGTRRFFKKNIFFVIFTFILN
jgi:hypothetical protein